MLLLLSYGINGKYYNPAMNPSALTSFNIYFMHLNLIYVHSWCFLCDINALESNCSDALQGCRGGCRKYWILSCRSWNAWIFMLRYCFRQDTSFQVSYTARSLPDIYLIYYRETTLAVYALSLFGMIVYTFTLNTGHIIVVYMTSSFLGYAMTGQYFHIHLY